MVASAGDANSPYPEKLGACRGNTVGLQVEKEVERARRRERAVVSDAEALLLFGLEDKCKSRGEDGVFETAVLVNACRRGKLQISRQGGHRMDVSAPLVDVVVILVPAVERPFGPRLRIDVVEAVDEALALAEVQSVLQLAYDLPGAIDDACGV